MSLRCADGRAAGIRRWRTLIRVILGGLLLWAAATKLTHPAVFFSALLEYGLPLPEIFFRLVAAILPWFEVFCGVALLIDGWAETVRPVVTVLFAVFVVMLGQAWLRGLDLNCGCFGSSARSWMSQPGPALLRAAALLAGSIYLTLSPATEMPAGGSN